MASYKGSNLANTDMVSRKLVLRLKVLVLFVAISSQCLGADVVSGSVSSGRGDRVLMGWLETVFIMPWGRRFTAKLDTGASSSSLHADKIEHFTKNGEEWVRFRLEDLDGAKAETVEGERPLLRTAYIKNHNKMSSKRDVVMLTVCKNGREYETEFNLVDRSNFNYPVLLGRSFLAKVAIVDSSATFLFKGESDGCAGLKIQVPAR